MRGLSRLAALLEAFLFVKGDPVTMEELVSTLKKILIWHPTNFPIESFHGHCN